MGALSFSPYRNESDTIQLADLTTVNRLDRVRISGSIDLTKDKVGLHCARELKQIIDLAVAELENSKLPDRITVAKQETVINPCA